MKARLKAMILLTGLILSMGMASQKALAQEVPYFGKCVHSITAPDSSMYKSGTRTVRDENNLGYYYYEYYTCGACGYTTYTRVWFD